MKQELLSGEVFCSKVKGSEDGRTMLEMLGVIGLICVLSAGGVGAYTLGMRLFKTNHIHTQVEELVEGIKDTYSWARSYSQVSVSGLCDNEIVPNACNKAGNSMSHIGGGAIKVSSAERGTTFLITYEDVEEKVCQALVCDQKWTNARIVSPSKPANVDTCQPDCSSGRMVFSMKSEDEIDLVEDIACETDMDCSVASCEICEDGTCVYSCEGNTYCAGGSCQEAVCVSDSDCGGTTPYCKTGNSPAENICVACLTDGQCDTQACETCQNNVCETSCGSEEECYNGGCVEIICQTDSACRQKDIRTPYCKTASNPANNTCVACLTDSQCDTAVCEICSDNTCVNACTASELCDAGVCKTPACVSDSDCTSVRPYCQVDITNALNNACVACKTDAQCGACETCVDHVCQTTCSSTQTCLNGTCQSQDESPCGDNEYHDINTGECVLDENCPDGQFWDSLSHTCYTCPTEGNPLVSHSLQGETSCRKCQNSVETTDADYRYACLYCPSPRVNCFKTCCAEGEVCVGNGWGSGTCQTPACTRDADCTDPALPLCDTETGQCFSGCRTNEDCASGEFCNLDVSTTGYSCTRAPGQGTCQAATIGGTSSLGYTWSSFAMNWWSAQNFCKALGKSLVSDPSSRCTSEEWAIIKQIYSGTCVGWKTGENIWGWTAKLINSCDAYFVNLLTGKVNYYSYYRNINYQALCSDTRLF